MIKFHKNGVMIMRDSLGRVHILERNQTLQDVAKYIWREESLKDFKIEDEKELEDVKDIIFVDLEKKELPRLRSISQIFEDTYFEGE